jgi:hypothetical protein
MTVVHALAFVAGMVVCFSVAAEVVRALTAP